MDVSAAIRLTDVSLLLGERWILRKVSWAVPRGVCVAILGPNGSGKSTLTRIIGGYLWPTVGRVEVSGYVFGEDNLTELRRQVPLVQFAGPYDIDPALTAQQVVVTGFFGTLSLYDTPTNEMRSAADAILQRVGLSRVRDHRYSTLSSGERVRALVGRALVHRPPVLLLDEPTAGLDLRSREQVLGTIQRLVSAPGNQTTVVLVTHHVEELPPITSRVLLLGDGRVAAEGAPREVLQSDILSGVYGCRVVVRHSHGRFSLHVAPDAWDELLEDPSHPDGPEGNTSDSSAPSA